MAITSLFGPTPAQIEQARQLQMDQQIAGEGAELGPFRGLYQAGRRLGSAGGQALVSGLFPEAADPALKQAQAVQLVQQKYQGQNLSDPTVLKSIASDLFSAGAPDAGLRILKTAQDLTPKDKFITGKAGEKIYRQSPTGELTEVASIPDKDTIVKTSEAAARAAGELGFGVRPNLSDYSEQELRAINNLLQTRGERVQAAGVPQSGQVKIVDLKGAQDVVNEYTKGPQERLNTVRQLAISLREVKGGVGTALPQVRRNLVKLVGDSQIGMAEAQNALGSIGIVGNVVSGINELFTGVPSPQKIADVEKFLKALETEHAKAYNSGRNRAEAVLGEANLNPNTVKTLIPPEYKIGGQKPKSNFVEGKVYVDANGNRARYVNGKWEPVQ